MMPPHGREPERQRVWDAIEALEYRPESIARGMRPQRTQPIGFISDEIDPTPFAAKIIPGAIGLAWEHDFLRFSINTSREQELNAVTGRVLLNREGDGMIYTAISQCVANPLQHLGKIPAVLPDFFGGDKSLLSVAPAEVKGGCDVVRPRVSACCNHRANQAREQTQADDTGYAVGPSKVLSESAVRI